MALRNDASILVKAAIAGLMAQPPIGRHNGQGQDDAAQWFSLGGLGGQGLGLQSDFAAARCQQADFGGTGQIKAQSVQLIARFMPVKHKAKLYRALLHAGQMAFQKCKTAGWIKPHRFDKIEIGRSMIGRAGPSECALHNRLAPFRIGIAISNDCSANAQHSLAFAVFNFSEAQRANGYVERCV